MSELIFEIGCEEIPASYVEPALAGMKASFERQCTDLKLNFKSVEVQGTPCRLVLLVKSLDEKQEGISEEITGPKEEVAYKDGKLSPAGFGFLKSRGLSENDAYLIDDPKAKGKAKKAGKVIAAKFSQKGERTKDLLPKIFEKIIHQTPFPKRMHWESSKVFFARPITWLCCVFNSERVDFEIAGLKSDNKTRGHRFLNSEFKPVENIESYKEFLEQNNIILSKQSREAHIVEDAKILLHAVHGELYLDNSLLSTVSNLVEKPWAILGKFNEKFLNMPKEIIIAEMVEHQKYFPVLDKNNSNKLLPYFVVVAGSGYKSPEEVVRGHERVLTARLEDGAFYFEQDKAVKLEAFAGKLKNLKFHRELGSVTDKVSRIKAESEKLFNSLNSDVKQEDLFRAADLCKADLVSGVVGEFPELQGVMGKNYAGLSGEPEHICTAIEEHYWPLAPKNDIPKSDLSCMLALADRIDNLNAIGGLDKLPKGSADPFALRRAAIGVCKIILAKSYRLSLSQTFSNSKILEFVKMRLRVMLFEELKASGFDDAKRVVDAAMGMNPDQSDDIVDLKARVDALVSLKQNQSDVFEKLAETFKRACNIVAKAKVSAKFEILEINKNLLAEPAERKLFESLEDIKSISESSSKAYVTYLSQIAGLQPVLENFFDNIMVMAKEEKLKNNRLALLSKLEELALKVADFKRL